MPTIESWLLSLGNLPDMPNVHNLFSSQTSEGRTRLSNLTTYFQQMLKHNPEILLIGEAPGYQGTYRTGVPFCSEAIMMGPQNRFGIFGGVKNGYKRAYEEDRLWKEPSATIVQRTLEEIPQPMLIWATFPLHPYRPGIELSNRAPNRGEVELGAKLLNGLIEILQIKRIVAVGNIADACLKSLEIEADKVRHPSHGGATQFREQLIELIAQYESAGYPS